ncbi:hypothetical protein SAMN05421858_3290 [Haladaptatus litoreus]|uniref:Uncharacterized protein n=1 Tax=Haladaptatus litoreus TaxID=553468 RepID=A0A1N7CVX1_9EURY|nr:hypothetical protein SAMN05421858_3290 [Haladaptatus litoreus]
MVELISIGGLFLAIFLVIMNGVLATVEDGVSKNVSEPARWKITCVPVVKSDHGS